MATERNYSRIKRGTVNKLPARRSHQLGPKLTVYRTNTPSHSLSSVCGCKYFQNFTKMSSSCCATVTWWELQETQEDLLLHHQLYFSKEFREWSVSIMALNVLLEHYVPMQTHAPGYYCVPREMKLNCSSCHRLFIPVCIYRLKTMTGFCGENCCFPAAQNEDIYQWEMSLIEH